MTDVATPPNEIPAGTRVLTLPDSSASPLSIRAKALLFEDPASLRLLEHTERVARSDATVLVIGESGTGKELIARHLHQQSGRQGPFVAVNCGAFSESLIDAELFGHEAGAFTGATQARAGWFEAAQGGTLFLDEIGDFPLSLQVKLLRVLQERQVVRLGSRKTIALDVRLVAATHIDLRQAVQAQHFREDLYWRLSVATLELPPLRKRVGDVLPLARHFLQHYGARLGRGNPRLTPDAEAALVRYAWPGNIRELENVIHFALIVCPDAQVRAADLRLVQIESPILARSDAPDESATDATTAIAAGPAVTAASAPAHEPVDAQLQLRLKDLLDQRTPELYARVEQALVQLAFERSGSNQVQAARLLGVTRNTLRTLLKRHGLLSERGSGGSDTALCAAIATAIAPHHHDAHPFH